MRTWWWSCRDRRGGAAGSAGAANMFACTAAPVFERMMLASVRR
ncbi:MAG TPA: hypothetical protein VE753_07680 [Gaiellaceae bacterium]|nr:hypothetical protein [Gaiellaceae bacterium]